LTRVQRRHVVTAFAIDSSNFPWRLFNPLFGIKEAKGFATDPNVVTQC